MWDGLRASDVQKQDRWARPQFAVHTPLRQVWVLQVGARREQTEVLSQASAPHCHCSKILAPDAAPHLPRHRDSMGPGTEPWFCGQGPATLRPRAKP